MKGVTTDGSSALESTEVELMVTHKDEGMDERVYRGPIRVRLQLRSSRFIGLYSWRILAALAKTAKSAEPA